MTALDNNSHITLHAQQYVQTRQRTVSWRQPCNAGTDAELVLIVSELLFKMGH
jgi:hypothetical protein